MAGVLQGFQVGYNAMNQYFQQEENKRRYNEQQAIGQQRYDDQYALRLNQDQRAQEQSQRAGDLHGINMTNAGLQTQINQYQVDRQPIIDQQQDQAFQTNQRLSGIELDNAQKQGEMADYQFKNQQDADRKQQLMQRFGAVYQNMVQTGDPSQMADFMLNTDLKGTNLDVYKREGAIDALSEIPDNVKNGDNVSLLKNFNIAFKGQLNKQVGTVSQINGGTIQDIEPVKIIADPKNPESRRMVVNVMTDKGPYQGFLSELDGNPKTMVLDEMIGTVSEMSGIAKLLKKSGHAEKFAQGAMGYIQSQRPQPEGTDPAAVNTVRHIAKVKGISEGKAWDFYKNKDSERQQYILKVLSGLDSFVSPEERQAVIKSAGAEFDQVYGLSAAANPSNTAATTTPNAGGGAMPDLSGDDPLGLLGGE